MSCLLDRRAPIGGLHGHDRCTGWPVVLPIRRAAWCSGPTAAATPRLVAVSVRQRGVAREVGAHPAAGELGGAELDGRVPAGPPRAQADRPGRRRDAVRRLPAHQRRGAARGSGDLGNIVRRAFCSAYAGYWVDARVAGRGVIPTALALAVDHAFQAGGLHRIEVNIRPENNASRRVVEKLGFREEAYHPRTCTSTVPGVIMWGTP